MRSNERSRPHLYNYKANTFDRNRAQVNEVICDLWHPFTSFTIILLLIAMIFSDHFPAVDLGQLTLCPTIDPNLTHLPS